MKRFADFEKDKCCQVPVKSEAEGNAFPVNASQAFCAGFVACFLILAPIALALAFFFFK